MYALIILDVHAGLVHSAEKPWRYEELLEYPDGQSTQCCRSDLYRAPHRTPDRQSNPAPH